MGNLWKAIAIALGIVATIGAIVGISCYLLNQKNSELGT